MSRPLLCGAIAASTLLTGFAGYGCASDETGLAPDNGEDAGGNAPWTEPTPSNAGEYDAASDADVDAAAGPRCTRDGWCTTPLPRRPPISGKRELRDVWADATRGAWAVANGDAEILHFENGEWRIKYQLPTSLRVTLAAIAVDSTGRIVAVGGRVTGPNAGDVVVIHSDDGMTFEFDVFDFNLFAADRRHWLTLIAPFQQAIVLDLLPVGPREFLVGTIDGIYRGDGATTWSRDSIIRTADGRGSVYALWGTADDLHACGASSADQFDHGGWIARRTAAVDGGPADWAVTTRVADGVYGACLAGWRAVDGNDSWVASTANPKYAQVDDGEAVVSRVAGTPPERNGQPTLMPAKPVFKAAPYRAIGGSGADDVWVVGAAAAIYHFDGATWTGGPALSSGAPLMSDLNAVAVLPSGEAWIVGDNIALYRKPRP